MESILSAEIMPLMDIVFDVLLFARYSRVRAATASLSTAGNMCNNKSRVQSDQFANALHRVVLFFFNSKSFVAELFSRSSGRWQSGLTIREAALARGRGRLSNINLYQCSSDQI